MTGITKVLDTLLAFRIIKLLTQRWTETDAFRLGIIDSEGNFLKKTNQLTKPEEKKAFTKFHVIVWKIRKLLEKIPFMKAKLSSLLLGLWMLKEEFNDSDDPLLVEKIFTEYLKEHDLLKHINMIMEEAFASNVPKREATYELSEDVWLANGAVLKEGEHVMIKDEEPIGSVMNVKIYRAYTVKESIQLAVTASLLRGKDEKF